MSAILRISEAEWEVMKVLRPTHLAILDRIARFRQRSRWLALAVLLLGALAMVGLTDPQSASPEDTTGNTAALPPADEDSPAGGDDIGEEVSKVGRGSSEDDRLWFTVTFEGKPVPGAEVRFARKARFHEDMKLSPAARTDEAGRMFVNPDSNAECVVQPLGGIHGILTLGRQVWTNQWLGLCRASESVQKPSFEWSDHTRTDEQGRYHFPKAGQGAWEIWLRTPRLREEPEVFPGRGVPLAVDYPFGRRLARVEIYNHETVETNIHSQGRIITGRVVVANPIRPVDLRASTLNLRFRDSGGRAGLTGAFVQKDGSFTLPCLEPGEYQMHLTVAGAPAAGPASNSKVVGVMEPRPVSVPPNLNGGTKPLDLGDILLTLRKPLFLADRAPDFEALTFEGNTLRLADWLGQPLLLIFGYPGVYNRTRNELGRFDEWYEGRGESERAAVVLVGVGSADDLDWLRAGGYPWPTIDANEQRPFFEEEYEATWAPDLILLDAQGRVAARDYHFDEIRPGIERLMSEFAAAGSGKRAASVSQESLGFDVFWPPHDPRLPDQRRRRPILNGAIETRVIGPSEEPAFAAVSVTLTRPRDEMSREFWNNRLAFPDHDWMSRVRVWDANERWLWPNLPYLLRLPGKERTERYGGVDPGKGVDNDFAAVLIRSYDSEGNESVATRETPFVSAEWHPEGVRGAVDTHTVVHVARSDDFRISLGDGRVGSAGKLAVWLVYADFFGFDLPTSWPKEPEYAGGGLSYFEIDWRREADGSWDTKTRSAAPPDNTGFDWASWVAGGGVGR